MTGNALAKARSFLLRGLAVVIVVLTYTVGSVGTQVAGLIGVSGVMLATTSTPAQAQWRRYRRRVIVVPRRRYRRAFVVPRRRVYRRRW